MRGTYDHMVSVELAAMDATATFCRSRDNTRGSWNRQSLLRLLGVVACLGGVAQPVQAQVDETLRDRGPGDILPWRQCHRTRPAVIGRIQRGAEASAIWHGGG